jgi:hypothetical protein
MQCRQQALHRDVSAIRTKLEKLDTETLQGKLKTLQTDVAGADLKGMRTELKALSALKTSLSEVAALQVELGDLRMEIASLKASEKPPSSAPTKIGASVPTARAPKPQPPKPIRRSRAKGA